MVITPFVGDLSRFVREFDTSYTMSNEEAWVRVTHTVSGNEPTPPFYVRVNRTVGYQEPEKPKTTKEREKIHHIKMAEMTREAAIQRGEFGYKPLRRPNVPKLRPEVHARSHPSCERRRHC